MYNMVIYTTCLDVLLLCNKLRYFNKCVVNSIRSKCEIFGVAYVISRLVSIKNNISLYIIYLVNNLVRSKIYCKYKLPFLNHMSRGLNNEGGIGILACSSMNNLHLAIQLCNSIYPTHKYRDQNSFYPYSPLKQK